MHSGDDTTNWWCWVSNGLAGGWAGLLMADGGGEAFCDALQFKLEAISLSIFFGPWLRNNGTVSL